MRGLKITVVGGGSSYTPEIADGIIRRKDRLPVDELALLDIESGREKAAVVRRMIERMFSNAGMDTKVTFTTDPHEAFGGADHIICQIRVGGLTARAKDERIPLEFGIIGQETTGAGGMANGLRSVPAVLELARIAEKVCPDAWFINFANPAGMVTEALVRHSNMKAIGLCNVPINMAADVKNSIHDHEKLGIKEETTVEVRSAGLNHLSWVTQVIVDGKDILSELLDLRHGGQLLANVSEVEGTEDFIRKLGMLPSPYLNYFYFEKHMLEEERHAAETEGTRAEVVMRLEQELFERYGDTDQKEKPVQLEKRGGSLYSEAAVSLIESLVLHDGCIHVLNVMNKGAIPSLPEDWVVEVPCIVDADGIRPIRGKALPPHAEMLVRTIKAYELATIEAALTGNRRKLMEAMLCHPLIRDAIDIEPLMNALIEAHGHYLPAFNDNK